MKRWNLIYLSIAIFSFLFTECRKGPTEPEKKSPREYTWTIDTLSYPGSYQTAMMDIWASSPSNVYVVGHNDQVSGNMYRFNGQSWSAVKLLVSDGGMIPYMGAIAAIYGFSASDIFGVGFKGDAKGNLVSQIIHFDGVKWLEMETPSGGSLETVWGSSPTNIWAAGMQGTLMRYDGTSWSSAFVDSGNNYMKLFGFSSDQLYLLGERGYAGPRFLLSFDGSKWSRIDSLSLPQVWSLGGIGGALYAVGEGGIYSRKSNNWSLKHSVPDKVVIRLFSNEPSNAFATGTAANIYHFNGIDWTSLNIISGESLLTGISCNDREAFIIGHDYGGFKTIILHGK